MTFLVVVVVWEVPLIISYVTLLMASTTLIYVLSNHFFRTTAAGHLSLTVKTTFFAFTFLTEHYVFLLFTNTVHPDRLHCQHALDTDLLCSELFF